MGLFSKSSLPVEEVKQLRDQGMSDSQIIDELKAKGFSLPDINNALAQSGMAGPGTPIEEPPAYPEAEEGPVAPEPMMPSPGIDDGLYGRIEEIAETIIDEKWDLLVEEVKKIIGWKEKVENQVNKLENDVSKLKEDFKVLHQGVLGKLESYDSKMTEVGTELKAVGKVFKDVIPEFVENVKELKSVAKRVGKK